MASFNHSCSNGLMAIAWVFGPALLTACTIEVPAVVGGEDELGSLDGDSLDDDGPDDDDGLDGLDGLDDSTADDGDELPLLDMLAGEPEPTPYCQIPLGQLDGLPSCDLPTPSEVVAPTIAWTWTGPGNETSVLVTPLVGNLDDDNGDGFVDLCDTPDVVVAAVDLPPSKTEVAARSPLYRRWSERHDHAEDRAPDRRGDQPGDLRSRR
jgi:hypothetical protein